MASIFNIKLFFLSLEYIPYTWVQFLNAGMFYIIGWREYISNWACFVFTCAAGSLNGVSQRSGSRVASTSTSCKYGWWTSSSWGNKEALPRGVPWVPTGWGEQGQQQHPLPQLLLHLDHLPHCQCVFVFVFFLFLLFLMLWIRLLIC